MSQRYPKRPNTRDWVMGVYPMPVKEKLTTLDELVEELEEFHHDEAARLVMQLVQDAYLRGWQAGRRPQSFWRRVWLLWSQR